MEGMKWRAWARPYGLPTLLLLGSLGLMFVFWDDPDVVWIFFVAPALAFLSGLVVRPAHAWITPAAVAGVIAAASLAAYALGLIVPGRSAPEFVVGMLVIAAFAVALPQTFLVWAGREIGSGVPRLVRRHKGPGASTT